MKFTNEIRLPLPAEEIFATLTDVEMVAGCLPGARVEGRDGEAYHGAMRIKVGPITADYAGTLRFEQLDADAHRAVLLAHGEETAGQGGAEARIVSSVLEDGDGALVVVETDLQVHGRVAQFGNAAMEKISKRLFAQFASNLEQLMSEGQSKSPQPAGIGEGSLPDNGSGPTGRSASDRDSRPANESSLDLLGLVADPLQRLLRASAPAVAVAFGLGYLLGSRRGKSTT